MGRGGSPYRVYGAENQCFAPQRWGPEPAPDDEPVLVGAGFRLPLGLTYLSLITVRCVASPAVFWRTGETRGYAFPFRGLL